MAKKEMLRPPVEVYYKEELDALKANDNYPKPKNWNLSPVSIKKFILGTDEELKNKTKKVKITQKYYGDPAQIERCIITLAGNRGLMLVGDPGTAKTMLSELLSAAISGTSNVTIQGSAGITDDIIKYSWNYALLLSKGPSEEALIKAPLYNGMENGLITRFEEITRCPSEVQDTLVSVMSDKVLAVPELGEKGSLYANPGFNVIATANTRDVGINEMSSALKRRFNFETIAPISNSALEAKIIEQEVSKLLKLSEIEMEIDRNAVEILASTFSELREGITKEGYKIDKPDSVMSTAEAVSVYLQSAMTSHYYGEKEVKMEYIVQNLMGAVLKESRDDLSKLKNYFNTIVKGRTNLIKNTAWDKYYEARKWIK